MQLLYIWVKEYKCFKNEGFNFSTRHKFKFNYDEFTLEYWENKDYIEKFFSIEENGNKSNKKKKYDQKGIINALTAIVGNNGAGKTTLLEMIFSKFTCEKYKNELDIITCFEDNEKIKVYSKINKTLYVKNHSGNKKIFETYESDGCKNDESTSDNIEKFRISNNHDKTNEFYESELKKKLFFIYYSSAFDYKYYRNCREDSVYDISTIGSMKRDNFNGIENNKLSLDKDPNINFFQSDFYRQIQFIYDFQESQKLIDFNLPSSATVGFINLNEVIELIYKRLYSSYGENLNFKQTKRHIKAKINKYIESGLENTGEYISIKLLSLIMDINDLLGSSVDKRQKQKEIKDDEIEINTLGIKIVHGILISFLYELILCGVKARDSLYKSIIKNMEEYVINKINSKSNINEIFECIKDFIEQMLTPQINKVNEEKIKNYIISINKIKDWIKSSPIDEINLSSIYGNFSLKVNNSKEDMNSLGVFYDAYKETAKYFNYLEFAWPVSTGEYNMISLFARFYSLIDKRNKLLIKENEETEINEYIRQDVIILIDEADMTFHPEWQQKYIKKLISFLQNVYSKFNMQLIITTHSPIMLSDIPSDNVIFLYKEKGEDLYSTIKENDINTFGSNIYNLYRDGFFLKDNNLGILGDFATYQIQELQNILLKYKGKIVGVDKRINKRILEAHQNGNKIDQNELEKIRLLEFDKFRDKAIEELKYCKRIIDIIGEKFIRDIIMEQYNFIYKTLEVEKDKAKANNIKQVDEIKSTFEGLSKDDQNEIIKYIIQSRKK
jgi:predicted ATP-binding protein involved in virulence